MIGAASLAGVADWIGTFALHSTCALAIALLVTRALGNRAIALQEHVLRSALWLALVSASVQVTWSGGAWSPNFALPEPGPAPVAIELRGDATSSSSSFPASDYFVAPVAAAPFRQVSWAAIVVAAAGAFAAGGLLWLWNGHRRLRRVLAGRSPEVDSRVLRTAAEVAREAGLHQTPHLSRCAAIATPIAFGWLRPEICLPARVAELGDASLRAMIAHEIAHLRRGDPAAMWLAAALQALFPWQVLLFVARRRWARLVELRCDAIAAGHSSATAVARCLLDVAEWLRPDVRQPGMTLAMAARPSSLRERVEAALRSGGSGPARRRLTAAWSVVSLAGLTFGGPGVRSVDAPELVSALEPTIAVSPAPSLVEAALAVEVERRSLVREVEQLQREFANAPSNPDLAALHVLLRERLANLERTSARLQARLARSPSEAR